jgi:hypothetical protein
VAPRAGAGAQGDGEVLPEQQVLQQEGVPVVAQRAPGAEQLPAPVEHGRSVPHGHLPALEDGLLAPCLLQHSERGLVQDHCWFGQKV